MVISGPWKEGKIYRPPPTLVILGPYGNIRLKPPVHHMAVAQKWVPKMGYPGKWEHGYSKPAVCLPSSILSHTHMAQFPPPPSPSVTWRRGNPTQRFARRGTPAARSALPARKAWRAWAGRGNPGRNEGGWLMWTSWGWKRLWLHFTFHL